MWYVYVDYLHDTWRPFYVGKGLIIRVKFKPRNQMWKRIVRKHGFQRDVVFASMFEVECLRREVELIASLHTYRYDHDWNGIGCNFTRGGEGVSGFKMSKNARQSMSRSAVRRCADPVWRAEISKFHTTLWTKQEYRRKMMTLSPVPKEQLLIDDSVLTWDGIARKYNVSASTVKKWFSTLGIEKKLVKQVHSYWSDVEKRSLMKMYQSGMLIREIATVLDRSDTSVRKMMQSQCDIRGIKRSRYRRKL